MTPSERLPELIERARKLVDSGDRRILGITGPPASGKSTLARRLATELAPDAIVVPMDGFHLANAELLRLGRRDRKGAPDTFDAAGYVALLRRLRAGEPGPVYAPTFDRSLEEAIAGAIPVPPEVPLVVAEGNYLLYDDGPWAGLAPLLDEVWYLEPPEEVRLDRLVRRHVEHGKTEAEAVAWSHGTDQRNASLIADTRPRATLVVYS
jgi:pantothenate kinase